MSFTGIILAGGRGSRFGLDKLKLSIGSVPLMVDQIFKLSFFCDEIIISTSNRQYPVISSEISKIDSYKKEYNFDTIAAAVPEKEFNVFIKRITQHPNIKIISDEYNFKNTHIKNVLNVRNINSPAERPNEVYKECGPIMGIYSGLVNAAYFYSIVTAFDMPFISYKLLKFLTDESRTDTGHEVTDSYSKTYCSADRRDACIIKGEKGFEVLCGLYSKNCTGILKKNIEMHKYKISDIFNYLNMEIITEKKLRLPGIDNLNFFNINWLEDYLKFKKILQDKKNIMGSYNTFTDVWNNFFFR